MIATNMNYKLQFIGTSLVAAGLFLLLLTVGLSARYAHERNHETGAGSGSLVCLLLTFYIAAACSAVIIAHSIDSKYFCQVLENSLMSYQV